MSKENSLFVPFSRPSITKEEEDAMLKVLRSGWLTTGKEALAFEEEFSSYMNCVNDKVMPNRKDAGLSLNSVKSLAVNSNTSGMILAMEACGVAKGKAIITTPYTFVSTAMCARHLDADVIFADIEKDTYNIDPNKIEEILKTDKEKKICAIVPVHIAGCPCNMAHIVSIARKYNVKVIEDAAHAFPALTNLGYCGTIGDIGVFSFYVTKTMTTAEGGMVCTRDSALYNRMEVMRLHGMDRTTWDRYTSKHASWEYDIVAQGYKFNLPDLLATLGRVQLRRADSFFEKRKKIVQKYNDAFKNINFLQCPPDGEGNAWHLYLLRIKSSALQGIDRNGFAKEMQDAGLGISVHFIPLFHFTYWKNLYPNFNAENFPNTEKQYQATITIPLWPDMSEEMVNKVISVIIKIGQKYE